MTGCVQTCALTHHYSFIPPLQHSLVSFKFPSPTVLQVLKTSLLAVRKMRSWNECSSNTRCGDNAGVITEYCFFSVILEDIYELSHILGFHGLLS